MLQSIVWDVNPVIVELFGREVRWYGLMWGVGFLIGFELISRIFKNENGGADWADKIFIYMFVGTIIGARLGHCLFYEHWFDWVDSNGVLQEGYISHPLNLLKVWEGGLSSHGGAFGILVSMYLYNRNVTKKGFIWIFDRLVIPVAFVGACIRFGNLMNSEIYGEPTNLAWGFEFVRDYTWHKPIAEGGSGGLPVHPTQIYEILYCLVALGVTSFMYWKKRAYERKGLIFGTFLLIIFGTRFLLEFIKNNQESFEQNLLLNMGQILSIPFIIWGCWLIINALKNNPSNSK
ncbi:MAG: prolipoprotein diacylglyceryl transferase [Paludibacteraceae bacterium]|nr:prolipoprotein diacylglyceryl transferase [Paludibacteraceae bacterium]MBN2787734.1 prolipoprotein diacylglyceryl transferase [Paludibacteraceae bacterium]